jgi:hypothetical protein
VLGLREPAGLMVVQGKMEGLRDRERGHGVNGICSGIVKARDISGCGWSGCVTL